MTTSERYQGYSYAYPHKSAYRHLPRPRRLGEVWAHEPTEGRALYVHVPFCESRCGFCNLFTQHRPPAERPGAYLDALEREVAAVAGELGPAAYARIAVGGGTPTLLSPAELTRLFDLVERFGAHAPAVPVACETSPATATPDRLAVLAERGVDRVSIGVQSFVPAETRALARPQDPAEVHRALEAIAAAGFARTNVDLIYGIDGQTDASFVASIDEALRHRPEELYLYPLYVRPLTGLGRSSRSWDDVRHDRYRAGRDHLLAHGYRQVSMRAFVLDGLADLDGPRHDCQDDGMVGLGVGARSYTAAFHHSRDFAVGRGAVTGIVDDYLACTVDDLRWVDNGFALDADEQRRRWTIKSLLRWPGLDRSGYRERFGADVLEHRPELGDLVDRGWVHVDPGAVTLTEEGLGWSDRIGPLLGSDRVRRLGERFELR